MSGKITISKPDLTQYQIDNLYCDSRFTITEASTKVGKTFSHIWWIFEEAHKDYNQPGFNHWWVAPVYAQAKIAFNRMRNKVARSGLYKINQSDLTITTPLGSVIQFKSAEKPDNLFGEDVYSVVFDEAPRAREDAFFALRSTITATRGKMKLIGNFGGTANWMHQLKEKAKNDPNYTYFKITAWDAVAAGILEREEIEEAQRTLPPKVFKSLYLAEEQESDDMLCTFQAINDLFTNEHVERGTMYISADIALHGSDTFVIGVWDGLALVHYECIEKCEANEVTEILKSLAARFKVRRSNIVYDADGLGSFLRGYLQGAIPFNNGGKTIDVSKNRKVNFKNIKSQCSYKLADLINAGHIYIDCEINKTDLIQELECLQSFELDKDGKLQIMPKAKIKELIRRSPDILDMLMMRMRFELKTKSGGIRATNVNSR
tara:strand:+ start:3207 stop:4505 length:1299 start_codon:yes stop_codon:yes gene_type:complete